MNSAEDEKISPQAIVEALGSIQLPANELADFRVALQKRHASVLRLRREVDASKLPFETMPVDWYPLGRRLIQAGDRPSRHLAYAAGDYYLQDAGSLLALAACGADRQDLEGLTLCDLCAAPGGKASGLLEAIGETGFLLANEPIRSRLAPLAFNLARTGFDRYAISCADPDQLSQTLPGQFDLVLVDAPCSGQALMGRGKQSVAAISTKQIQHSAARQERILDAAVRLLRPGGRLVYSTCTFASAENELQIDRLVQNGDVVPDPVSVLAAYETDGRDGGGTYRLWPHRHQCAGSFAASVKLSPQAPDGEPVSVPKSKRKKKSLRDREKDDARVLKSIPLTDWYGDVALDRRFYLSDSVVYSWPRDVPAWVTQIAVDGPELSHRTGQTWKPAHGAALRRQPMIANQWLDVDEATAGRFLSGETIQCTARGWHVVRCDGRPLGWVKASGGVGKNQLPAASRFKGTLDH